MLADMKKNIKDWNDVEEIDAYLTKVLNKEAYDRTGLIYGIGHAVYTISDPRAGLLKEMARELAKEKGREDEFRFMELIEERGVEVFLNYKKAGAKQRTCCLLYTSRCV